MSCSFDPHRREREREEREREEEQEGYVTPPPNRVEEGSNVVWNFHAKAEDVILLFNLLQSLDPKDVSRRIPSTAITIT